jgi:hypothetical protein
VLELDCVTCGKRPPLCDLCAAGETDVMIGTAAARGYAYGDELAQRADSRSRAAARPPFAAAARDPHAEARRRLVGLTRDARVLGRLVDRFLAEAERRYERRPRATTP